MPCSRTGTFRSKQGRIGARLSLLLVTRSGGLRRALIPLTDYRQSTAASRKDGRTTTSSNTLQPSARSRKSGSARSCAALARRPTWRCSLPSSTSRPGRAGRRGEVAVGCVVEGVAGVERRLAKLLQEPQQPQRQGQGQVGAQAGDQRKSGVEGDGEDGGHRHGRRGGRG